MPMLTPGAGALGVVAVAGDTIAEPGILAGIMAGTGAAGVAKVGMPVAKDEVGGN